MKTKFDLTQFIDNSDRTTCTVSVYKMGIKILLGEICFLHASSELLTLVIIMPDLQIRRSCCHLQSQTANILSRATFPGAPSYGGVRTWMEGSQTRALAETSNLLGYKENTYTILRAIKLPTNNAIYMPSLLNTDLYRKLMGMGPDNIIVAHPIVIGMLMA